MKLVRNAGGDRVIDLVTPWLTEGGHLDLVTPSFALFAFAELSRELSRLAKARVVLPGGDDDLGLVGTDADRGARKREAAKIECGRAHFAALKDGDSPVQYRVKRTLDELLASLGD